MIANGSAALPTGAAWAGLSPAAERNDLGSPTAGGSVCAPEAGLPPDGAPATCQTGRVSNPIGPRFVWHPGSQPGFERLDRLALGAVVGTAR